MDRSCSSDSDKNAVGGLLCWLVSKVASVGPCETKGEDLKVLTKCGLDKFGSVCALSILRELDIPKSKT